MTERIQGIRIAVRALIVQDGAVLVQRKVGPKGAERFTLPGGAPHDGEILIEALVRECQEEIGCTVRVEDLIHVADYFKPRDSDPPTVRQQVEMVWRCHVPAAYRPHNGPHPDKHQQEVVWLKVSDLCHKCFTPQGLSAIISPSIPGGAVYLGRID